MIPQTYSRKNRSGQHIGAKQKAEEAERLKQETKKREEECERLKAQLEALSQ